MMGGGFAPHQAYAAIVLLVLVLTRFFGIKLVSQINQPCAQKGGSNMETVATFVKGIFGIGMDAVWVIAISKIAAASPSI